MRNIITPYQTENSVNPTRYFWLQLLQKFRLLRLTFKRININDTSLAIPKLIFQPPTSNNIKTTYMKLQQLLLKCTMLLLLFAGGTNVIAQGPYPNTGDHQVCLNSVQPYGVVLTAGSTYAWSVTPLAVGNGTITPGATPNLITVTWTSVGTVTLKVVETNSSGCAGDPVSIIVTVNPIPTVTVNSSVICAGTSATITATPGIAGTYSYIWTVPGTVTNPGNVATFTSTVAGTYSVVITNTTTTCASASASGTVTINAAPNLAITNPATICVPATADLTAAAITAGSTAGLIFTYWTDPLATIPYPTPTNAPAGTYYIKGTLGAGCFEIKPVIVTSAPTPTVVITNPAPVCAPATVDITAAAITAGSTAGLTFTYWTNPLATIPYATPTAATAGTYYISGTSAAGCSDIKAVVVTAAPAPTVIITNPAPVCAPATVNITAAAVTAGSTAGLTYTYWTDIAATIPYATPTTATLGTYYIKGTTAGGCSDIKPVVVTINPLPTPLVTGPTPVCESISGSTATYSTPNVAGNTYTWVVTGGTIATGQGTNLITVIWTTPGAGSVSVTETVGAGGCSANVAKAVTITPKPVTSVITHN